MFIYLPNNICFFNFIHFYIILILIAPYQFVPMRKGINDCDLNPSV